MLQVDELKEEILALIKEHPLPTIMTTLSKVVAQVLVDNAEDQDHLEAGVELFTYSVEGFITTIQEG